MLWAEKVLSRNEVLVFFIVAALVYVFPIINADYAYIDDGWRSLLIADGAWRTHGRLLLEVFVKFFAFNNATINVFPFPLLIATVAMAFAMRRLTYRYFPQPRMTACLVVLPLLCSPFFLGNITFQYDGPGMMLAVVAAIYAISCDISNRFLRGVSSALLVTVIMAFYQLAITVFIGLCAVELIWDVRNKKSAAIILGGLAQRLVQLAVGGALYYLTFFQMIVFGLRGNLVFADPQWPERIEDIFSVSMKHIQVLMNSGNMYFVVPLLLVACAGFVLLIKESLDLEGSRQKKIVVLVFCLCVIPILLMGVPGVMLFLVEPYLFVRDYLGFSVVLFFLFLLNYECLGRVRHGLQWFLLLPTLWMFSLCYAYGQVLVAKKELETAFATFVAYDIVASPELGRADIIYLVLGPKTEGNWLPKGNSAMSYMPVLKLILTDDNQVLHPYFLPRLGINSVVSGRREMFEAAIAGGKASRLLLDRKFYSIYATEAGFFLVMKSLGDLDKYTHPVY
ncbi:glucosyltransferase domain-containing protein [Pseudomonas sp. NFACC07-1]|uniref:glucosyltransferase domain-containing protein n=1 Tax=Pseudomonas sp. NFACC07-1 TaxID=1566239 RepID=UPI0008CE6C11|nr:glucosyltransferase domain-containing protein [Pseudomonas sp. NFACC07-1]SEJ15416.1 Glucosyl transferase GtrII [Pseudomonas sp. NFACC07-1]